MIRSRSEYLFVTIPAGIEVDGNVMPKRYSNHAKMRVLRGLDAAFMIECVGERTNVMGGNVKKTALERGISGVPFSTAANWCRSNCGAYSPWRYQVEESTGFWDVASGASLADVYGRTIPLSSMESDWQDFTTGKPLVADKLMKLYRDMANFRRFLMPVWSSTISSSNYAIWSGQAGSADGHGCDAEIENMVEKYSPGGSALGGQAVYEHRATNFRGTVYESKGRYECTASLASGTYRLPVPTNARLDLYGEAQAYAKIHTKCTNPSGEWWDWVPVPAEKRTEIDAYEVGAYAIEGAAAQARSRDERVPVYTMDTVPAGVGGQVITQTVTALAIAVDLTDHTDWEG